MRKGYVATINILLDFETEGEACDFLAETLRDMPGVINWQYDTDDLGNVLTPIAVSVPDDYHEDDDIRALQLYPGEKPYSER